MGATTLALRIEAPALGRGSSWQEFEALAVEMAREVPVQALARTLGELQERLVDEACGPRWLPVPGLAAPFRCPRCGAGEDFARKGKRNRARVLHTAAGRVEIVLWQVGCRGCGKVFAPLLGMLGLEGKRKTDRLTLDLAELGSQMSFARAGTISRGLGGTDATGGAAHTAVADVAALLRGPAEGDSAEGSSAEGSSSEGSEGSGGAAGVEDLQKVTDGGGGAADAAARAVFGVLGPAHTSPDVVLLDGTGTRAGSTRSGVGVNVALGLTGRSGPVGRRRAHTHLLGFTVDEDWSMLGAQLARVAAPALVVVDGEASITTLAQRVWPGVPVQRCWWHLPHGLRKAFYSDDAADRHVNPRWARTKAGELAELLREQVRQERTPEQALAAWDAFTATIPASLTSARSYLEAARPHAFTCLDPALRARLVRLGGPELGTGVIERFMRELNARTDIGGSRWSVDGLHDLVTVLAARVLHHPAWTALRRATHPSGTIPFRLQEFNAR